MKRTFKIQVNHSLLKGRHLIPNQMEGPDHFCCVKSRWALCTIGCVKCRNITARCSDVLVLYLVYLILLACLVYPTYLMYLTYLAYLIYLAYGLYLAYLIVKHCRQAVVVLLVLTVYLMLCAPSNGG